MAGPYSFLRAGIVRGSFGVRSGVVGGAHVVSGAEKKAFDRGGPVWPPRSNAADDRLGGPILRCGVTLPTHASLLLDHIFRRKF